MRQTLTGWIVRPECREYGRELTPAPCSTVASCGALGTGTDTDTGPGTDTGTYTGPDTGTDNGPDTGTDTDTGPGTGTGTGTGTDPILTLALALALTLTLALPLKLALALGPTLEVIHGALMVACESGKSSILFISPNPLVTRRHVYVKYSSFYSCTVYNTVQYCVKALCTVSQLSGGGGGT